MWFFPYSTISDTIEAFQAPPAAVIPPVHHEPKIDGKISVFHRKVRSKRKLRVISRKSSGIALAPAITLNKMYHCVPRAIKIILPQPRSICQAINQAIANGKMKFAGKLARICTIGCIIREILGFMPITTPTGTQISELIKINAATRTKVMPPSMPAVINSCKPAVVYTK